LYFDTGAEFITRSIAADIVDLVSISIEHWTLPTKNLK